MQNIRSIDEKVNNRNEIPAKLWTALRDERDIASTLTVTLLERRLHWDM